MDNEIEVWKEIPELEGFYEVSSDGRVRSWIVSGGRADVIRVREKPKLLKVNTTKPTANVNITCGSVYSKKRYTRSLAKLVCEVFNGPAPQGLPCVRFIDGKTNYHYSNLEWESEFDKNNRIFERKTNQFTSKEEAKQYLKNQKKKANQ